MKNKVNLSVLLISVWILHAYQGVKTCSDIRQEGPAIQGRYVRLIFKQPSTESASSVQWKLYDNCKWIPIDRHSLEYNQHAIKGDSVLDIKLTHERIDIFANSECSSNILIIKPYPEDQEIKSCGKLYLEPKQFKPGTDIKIRYFPHHATPNTSSQTWRVINDTCTGPLGCVVSEEDGAIRMTRVTFYNDPEFILEIMSIITERDGAYFFQCDASKSTDEVKIVTPVRPSQPVILNQREIDKEGSRVVGVLNKRVKIECETYGGTDPQVGISVDQSPQTVTNNTPGMYSSWIHMSEQNHGKRIRCEVFNMALEAPLYAETTLYVTVPSGKPYIQMNVLKEGHPVNISCTSEGGRPTPFLKFSISNIDESLVQVIRSEVAQGGKNFSIIYLNKMERSWNSHTLQCCTVHALQREQCSTQTINYLFKLNSYTVNNDKDFTKENSFKMRDVLVIALVLSAVIVILAVIVVVLIIKRKRTAVQKPPEDGNGAEEDHHPEANSGGSREDNSGSTHAEGGRNTGQVDDLQYEALNAARGSRVYEELQPSTTRGQQHTAGISTHDPAERDYYNLDQRFIKARHEDIPEGAYEIPNV